MNARWYDPTVGRFLTQDTYRGDMTNPQTQNRYSYVMNNPVNMWDPTGHVAENMTSSQSIAGIPDWVSNRGPHEERSGITGEYWYYRGYDKITSEVRKTKEEADSSLKFFTAYFEQDVKETWYYDYNKLYIKDLGNGEILPGDYIVRDEPVTFFRQGTLNWTDKISAQSRAEEIAQFLAKNYTAPANANFKVKSIWATGPHESIFFNDASHPIKSGSQSIVASEMTQHTGKGKFTKMGITTWNSIKGIGVDFYNSEVNVRIMHLTHHTILATTSLMEW